MEVQLFRKESLEARKAQWLGQVVLARPLSFTLFTVFAIATILSVGLLLGIGKYAKRVTVVGQLVPQGGLVKIYSPQRGVITERFVNEGDSVDAGARLYSISSDRLGANGLSLQGEISAGTKGKISALEQELSKVSLIHEYEGRALSNKLDSLGRDALRINDQFELQKGVTEIAKVAYKRHQELAKKGYVSDDLLQQKMAVLLTERFRLKSLERERELVDVELKDVDGKLRSLTLKYENVRSSIERTILMHRQELVESEAQREIGVNSPSAGVVTAISAEVGQHITPSLPLLSVVPKDAELRADLYAPSSAIGFAKPGDVVLLRFNAYPYQKFGQHKGEVISISKAAMSREEIREITSIAELKGSGPYYRISVRLRKQHIQAYGVKEPLQVAMTVEADILQGQRRLYEWLLEPLYTLSGKLES